MKIPRRVYTKEYRAAVKGVPHVNRRRKGKKDDPWLWVYFQGCDGITDELVQRRVGWYSNGSGSCLLSGLRDMTFDFPDVPGAIGKGVELMAWGLIERFRVTSFDGPRSPESPRFCPRRVSGKGGAFFWEWRSEKIMKKTASNLPRKIQVL